MKNPIKILIVAALAVTVITAIALKQGRFTVESSNGAPPPAAARLPCLVDLGAGKCIPCKMMAPILEELKKEYAGKMSIEFIDVLRNPDAGKPYGVEIIPTQIFFDAGGKELFRHVGFFAKADILAKWNELGVVFAGKSNNGR